MNAAHRRVAATRPAKRGTLVKAVVTFRVTGLPCKAAQRFAQREARMIEDVALHGEGSIRVSRVRFPRIWL